MFAKYIKKHIHKQHRVIFKLIMLRYLT